MAENSFDGDSNAQGTSEVQHWLFDDFLSWLREVVSLLKPDLVVGIARGALRLFELHGIRDNIASVPIVSNNALSFMADSEILGRRVLIFDDSLIFGSTMASIMNYVYERGAIPLCAAYVVDRRNFFGEGKEEGDFSAPSAFSNLPLYYKHKLWPNDIRVHHDTLVRRLLNTPSHYNIDFPTAIVHAAPFSRDSVSYVTSLIRSHLGVEQLFDVTSADSAAHNIYRFSAPLPNQPHELLKTRFVDIRPFSKARFTIAGDLGQIRITPTIQLMMADFMPDGTRIFGSDRLQRQWDTLRKPHVNDRYAKQSTFRLLTYFISTLAAAEITRVATLALAKFSPSPRYSFLSSDIEMSVGRENAATLASIFTRAASESIKNFHGRPSVRCEPAGVEPVQGELVQQVADSWKYRPYLVPDPSEPVYEILGKIFIILRSITDSSSVRKLTPNADRLSVGLSFGSVRELLGTHLNIDLPINEISIGMDVCVDNGLAVPKILLDGDRWCRLFYSGERTESVDPLQLKNYYHNAYADFLKQKKAKRLTPYDIHKLSCSLKEVHPWLPFTTKFSIYGRVALANTTDEDLVKWLSAGPNPAFSILRPEGGRKLVQVNNSFKPIPHTVWPEDRVISFLDGFQFLAFAFNMIDPPHKLLLSTCLTHRHTYNSIAHEAHCWVQRGNQNFSTLVSATIMNPDERFPDRGYIVPAIYWCIRYMNEASLKYSVFHAKHEPLLKKIETAFRRQGNPALRFWQFRLAPRIDNEKDPEIETRFSYLTPIIGQMRLLTSYYIKVLLAANAITMGELKAKFSEEGVNLYSDDFQWAVDDDLERVAREYNEEHHSTPHPRRVYRQNNPSKICAASQ